MSNQKILFVSVPATYVFKKIVSFFPAITCPALDTGEHVILSTSDHHFNIEVNITCEPGYWFDPVAAVNDSIELQPVTVTCLHNESWSDSVSGLDCFSKWSF